MKLTQPQIDFLVKFRERLGTKEFLIATFNVLYTRPVVDIPSIEEARSTSGCTVGKYAEATEITKPAIGTDAAPHPPVPAIPGDIIFLQSGEDRCYGYLDDVAVDEDLTYVVRFLASELTESPLSIEDTFTIKTGMINSYNRSDELTSVGRFVLNQVVLGSTLGEVISYVNEQWDQRKLEKTVAKLVLEDKVSIAQFETFMDHVYFLGHFTKLNAPSSTPRSLYTDPRIAKRKEELIEENRANLHDPLVIRRIEQELIAMDRKFLEGDEATTVYEAQGSKTIEVHRKKMFLSVGGIQAFSEDPSEFEFIENSLEEGWEVSDFHVRANETRKSIYGRGKETAKGGEQTKFILRIFQDLEVVADDCGTTRGLETFLKKEDIPGLLGRTIVIGAKSQPLDEKLANSLVNKVVKLRSPMYCEQHGGICYKCTRDTYEKIGTGSISMSAMEVTSTFLSLSMKSVHGTVIKSKTIDVLDYIVDM